MSDDLNRTLGKSGAGQVVTALGRDWTIYAPDDKDRASFQAWLESRARRNLVAAKADMDPASYKEWVSITIDKINTGKYSWKSELAQEAWRSPDGFIRFFRILLNRVKDQEHVDDEYAAQLYAANEEEWMIVLVLLGLLQEEKIVEEKVKQGDGDTFLKKLQTRREKIVA